MGFQNHQRQLGIVRYARQAGWVLDFRLFSFHFAGPGQDAAYLASANFDGVLALCSRASPWLPELLARMSVPVVDMWADYEELPYPRVLLDHAAIGRAGAHHLLTRGFRDLLFYTHAMERRNARPRFAAFAEVAQAAGARATLLTWDPDAPELKGQQRIEWLAGHLRTMPLSLGVMASNDFIACEVLEAAQLAGLDVPRDVAVLGVDDDPLVTEVAPVPLSSIDSARERVGYEAAALLERLMDGAPAPAEPLLVPPGPVVTRRSTDVLAVRDANVAAAVAFIRDHFRELITVEQIAARAVVSRRHLQDGFARETGRTIGETIAWTRLEHAQHLLLTTREKVEVVAQRCGFGSGETMCKVFRRLLGTTPQTYRAGYTRDDPAAAAADAGPHREHT